MITLFKLNGVTAALLIAFTPTVHATAFLLPAKTNALIGTPNKTIYIKAAKSETLLDIARQHDLGQNQIVKANKTVDRWMPSKSVEEHASDKEGNQFKQLGEGKDIHIPNSYLLPSTARKGIVLNLPEYRLYYYRNGQVLTHPISIGRVDWNTPLGKTSIIAKTRNPTWTPPASIRREHAAKGDILPAVFPAGPNNPLGLFAMRLGRAGYLIHSTNKPLGVGMRVSHGCIRMYPEDIERIFPAVSVGTSVMIVNEPIKVGWSPEGLYIEVHPDLEDKQRGYQQRLTSAMNLIERAKANAFITIDGSALKKALVENSGIPVALYKRDTLINSTQTIIRPPQKQTVVTPTALPARVNKTAVPQRQSTPIAPAQVIVSPVILNQPAPVVDRSYDVVSSPVVSDNAVREVRVVTPQPVQGNNLKTYQPKAVVKKRLATPPRLNTPAAPVIRVQTTPPPQQKRYTPAPIQLGNTGYNNAGRTSVPAYQPKRTSTLPPPPPRLNDKVTTKEVSRVTPTPPKLEEPPKLAPPKLNKPQYSILKSAIPPN
ncbi:MAG: L,D-transpeptidase family protein [Methylococcales bacterium]|nr:L,D-transpeptidase family protein [Methylococcales bacterium]